LLIALTVLVFLLVFQVFGGRELLFLRSRRGRFLWRSGTVTKSMRTSKVV
jgi:hypothetical protein